MFSVINTKSSADAVFDQVADEIVRGSLTPGSKLPGERELASQLAVSRSVVREALQRLAQAGLIEIRQGGATTVLDYQDSCDLALLNRLIVDADQHINVNLIRSILQARIAIGSDAARLCALHATDDQVEAMRTTVESMQDTTDLVQRQRLDLRFWELVVAGSANLVYRLAFNGLAQTYRPILEVVTAMVEPEIADLRDHNRLVTAIERHEETRSVRAALTVLEASNSQWDFLLAEIEKENAS